MTTVEPLTPSALSDRVKEQSSRFDKVVNGELVILTDLVNKTD